MPHMASRKPVSDLPDALYYDRSSVSKALSISGLLLCWLAGVACLASGIYLLQFHEGGVIGVVVPLNRYSREVVPLASNVVITALNDVPGYIHATSLRWALQKESRLTFHSNLRLFTNAKNSRLNSWYINAMFIVFMVMSYSASGLLFIRVSARYASSADYSTVVSSYALITLSISILGQAVISTINICRSKHIHTWSSNPLDNAAACVASGSLHREKDRCMLAVHDSHQPSVATAPRIKQRPAFQAHKEVRVVFWFMWIPVLLMIGWSMITLLVVRRYNGHDSSDDYDSFISGGNWAFLPVVDERGLYKREYGQDFNTQTPSMTLSFRTLNLDWGSLRAFSIVFAVLAVIQSVITISLHCAELLVNVVRDEKRWRAAISEKGLRRKNALFSMLTSAEALTLFLFKAVIHWQYTLAVGVYMDIGINMRIPQILYLGIGQVVLALFVVRCSLWKPKDSQPAAFGHMQTLANLVDRWPRENEKAYWGEKALSNALDLTQGRWSPTVDVRHAGTASQPLSPVNLMKLYS